MEGNDYNLWILCFFVMSEMMKRRLGGNPNANEREIATPHVTLIKKVVDRGCRLLRFHHCANFMSINRFIKCNFPPLWGIVSRITEIGRVSSEDEKRVSSL